MYEKQLKCELQTFLGSDFHIEQKLLQGFLFVDDSGVIAIIIDYHICDKVNPFKYNEYTKEQNFLMSKYNKVYRFVIDDKEDLAEFKLTYSHIQNNTFYEDKIRQHGTNRELTEIDQHYPKPILNKHLLNVMVENPCLNSKENFQLLILMVKLDGLIILLNIKNIILQLKKMEKHIITQ